jgi:hypothetical protein
MMKIIPLVLIALLLSSCDEHVRIGANGRVSAVRELNNPWCFYTIDIPTKLGYVTIPETDETRLIYDNSKIVDVLVKRDKMSRADARDFLSESIEGAYLGSPSPLFMDPRIKRMSVDEWIEYYVI